MPWSRTPGSKNAASGVIPDVYSRREFAPKVMHLLDHSLPLQSGYALRTHRILCCQLNRGWEPFALTSAKHEKSSVRSGQCETVDNIRYHRTGRYSQGLFALDTELRSLVSLNRRLRAVAAEEHPHLLHVHSPVVNALPALKLARRLRIPVVYEIHAFWEDAAVDQGTYSERSVKYRSLKALETWVCKQVAGVVALCEGLKQDLIARGLPEYKLHVASNGVNLEEFRSFAPDEEFRSRWGLRGKVVIGFLGSFYHYEGLDLLVEVFSVLARERRDLVLLLVGGGNMQSELERKTKRLGIEDKVIFPGRISHERVPGVYALVDVLVYPRHPMRLTELVTPLKPLEAMAAKRAVVASDVGGHRELIRDGETGILFKAGNGKSLKESLQRALDDKTLIGRLTHQAYHWVCREREWKLTTEVYSKVYKLALGLMDSAATQLALTSLVTINSLNLI